MKTISFTDDELQSLNEYYTQQLQTAEQKVLDIQNLLKKIDGVSDGAKIRKSKKPKKQVTTSDPIKRISSSKRPISIKDLISEAGLAGNSELKRGK